MVKIIIAAAGEGSRWNNFRGTSKHFTAVEGEILINRTIRQFSHHSSDITVISKYPEIPHVKVEPPKQGIWNDAAKVWSSNHLWSNTQRNIILFGDVWFSDEAVETIINNEKDICFFLRSTPSKVTNKPHKEIFAIAFNGEKIEEFRNVVQKVIEENKSGAGAYLIFRKICNLDNVSFKHHFKNNSMYVEINDWTEDFDYPKDLTRWEKRRLKLGGK